MNPAPQTPPGNTGREARRPRKSSQYQKTPTGKDKSSSFIHEIFEKLWGKRSDA
jgi:hypothetical protein